MTAAAGAATPPSRVPLTGADCFLRAFDVEIGRFNAASHVSQLVLRLGPGFDAAAFAALLADAARAQPMLCASVRRRLGIGVPVYRLPRPGRCRPPVFALHDVPGARGEALPGVFEQRLNERRSLRRGELLRCDAVRYDGGAAGTDLALSWLHLLFDGAGSERFIAWLDECGRGVRRVSDLPEPGELQAGAPVSGSFGERGDAAVAWKRWLDGFSERPLHSFAGPRRRVPQALTCEILTLDEPTTARVVAEAGRRAGFLSPMLFYLAVAIRAHHAVARRRGFDPGSYLVPLPVNLRPKGAEGAIFRTHVSLIWFQVAPSQVADMDELISALKEQRLAAIKAGYVAAGVSAMDFARFAPAPLYTRMARSNSPGELCSFFFAWTGEFLTGCDRFFGAAIRNAFHVAPVPASPGSCAAMSTRGGRLNVSHVHQRGVFSDAELEVFRASLRADLASGSEA